MSSGKALVGLVLVSLGVVLLLGNAEVFDAGEVVGQWWPTVIVAAGLLALVGRPRAIVGGLLVAGVGLGLLGMTTGLFGTVGWGVIGPILLIALGVWFVAGLRQRGRAADDDTVDVAVLFSGRDVVSTSQAFRGGSVTSVFGGVKLDLTRAWLADGAAVEAIAVFGGVEIIVPPGWRVRMNGPAIFGGYENAAETQLLPEIVPTLDVKVLAIFGGVDVKIGAAPASPTTDPVPPRLGSSV